MSSIALDVNERVNKDYRKLVVPWELPPIKDYCFVNAKIVDVNSGKILEGLKVFTSNGRIKKISSENEIQGNYTNIDCGLRFLCPGLIDAHVHIQVVPGEESLMGYFLMSKGKTDLRVGHNLRGMLERGFTTVRDCGGAELYIKQGIQEGSIIGPRLFIAGHALSQTGGHGHQVPSNLPGTALDSCLCHILEVGRIADGTDECLRASREELRQGADFIKVMCGGGVASPTDKITNVQYTGEEIRAFVEVANSYGTYVTAHAYTPAAIQHCIKNGIKGIEHGNLIDDETAKQMAANNCYLTPTLVTYKIMACDQFKSFLGRDQAQKNIEVLSKGLESLKIAKNNKVKMCYGSDLLGPLVGYQTQEFFIRQKVLSSHEILVSATTTPAEMLGLEQDLGQIKEGYLADMILLELNPLDNVSILDEPEKYLSLVMKEGRVYKCNLRNIPCTIMNI